MLHYSCGGAKTSVEDYLDQRVKETQWYQNSIPDLSQFPFPNDTIRQSYDLAAIGSSWGVYGIDFSSVSGIKGLNWCMQPQTTEYSYFILKKYADLLKPGADVFYFLCPFSGLRRAEFLDDRYAYVMDAITYPDFIGAKWRMEHPYRSHRTVALKKLFHDDAPRVQPTCTTDSAFNARAAFLIGYWKEEFNIADLNDTLTFENKISMRERLSTFEQICYFCKEKNLKLTVVLPPVTKSLRQYFSEQFIQYYLTDFLNMSRYQNFTVLDYMNNSELSQQKYYTDAFLMNTEGARVFTSIMLGDRHKTE